MAEVEFEQGEAVLATGGDLDDVGGGGDEDGVELSVGADIARAELSIGVVTDGPDQPIGAQDVIFAFFQPEGGAAQEATLHLFGIAGILQAQAIQRRLGLFLAALQVELLMRREDFEVAEAHVAGRQAQHHGRAFLLLAPHRGA